MTIISNKISFLEKFGIQDANENIKAKYNNLLFAYLDRISDFVFECKFDISLKQYQTLNNQELQDNKTYVCKNKEEKSFKVIKIFGIIYEQIIEEQEILFFAEHNTALKLSLNNIWEPVKAKKIEI
ncbi:MAG: hypothetical protein U1E31_02250 [Rickettsiales bacterium]